MRVFISYSHIDSDLAREIENVLKECKIDYFLDQKDIEWGEKIKEKVDSGISECTHLIVILSPASLKSLWVPYEVGNANALGIEVLPFLQHRSLDVPQYLKCFNSKYQIEDISAYFKTLAEGRILDQKTLPYHGATNVHISHLDLPNREKTLDRELKKQLRIFSTSAKSYFVNKAVKQVISEKLQDGARLRLPILSPDSEFMKDREYQERQNLIDEHRSSSWHIKELQLRFPGQIDLRFFKCAPTYQALLIDNAHAFISIPVYGRKGTLEFPCIEIVSGPSTKHLFQRFSEAFETLWDESGSYTYELIAYHDSWISLDPIIGCTKNCKYCVLKLPNWSSKKPVHLFSPIEAVNHLLNHRYFIHDKTIIALGNRTDPFLKENVDFTIEILLELEKRKISNPICIPTKCQIPLRALRRIDKLRHPKVVFFLSYSGLSADIEPRVKHSAIRKNFTILSDTDIPVIHFWRPLVAANTSPTQIEDMLMFVKRYSRASVIVGLKYCPELRDAFRANPSLRIPEFKQEEYGEWLPDGVEDRIFQIAKDVAPQYPIYKHTSCAVSYILGRPDYNGTMYRIEICNISRCNNQQRKLCTDSCRQPSEEKVLSVLERLGINLPFAIDDNRIFIKGSVTQEDYIFMLHNLNYPIYANIGFTNVWHGSIFKDIEKYQ